MEEGIYMAIISNLKDIREDVGESQEDVANATGSCSRTIGRYERGERNPSLEIALKLAKCSSTSSLSCLTHSLFIC